MKPKPLVALNHFTVPEAMVCILESSSLTVRGECASGQCAFGPAESTLSTGPVWQPSRAPGGLRAWCGGAIWTSRHLAPTCGRCLVWLLGHNERQPDGP